MSGYGVSMIIHHLRGAIAELPNFLAAGAAASAPLRVRARPIETPG
jgi:hypothetical protein